MCKYLPRGIVLVYLLVILLGPLAMMIYRTFEDIGGAWDAITDHNTLLAFKLTIVVAAIAVPVNAVFGIVFGLLVVRGNVPGKGLLNAFVDLPLALSPVVVGLSIVMLYSTDGWFHWLPDHGVQILFSWPAIVIATIFVSLPFVAREVVPTLREIGDEQEQAARTLGASGWQTFWRITLPSIRWAVIYGVVLTTARCLGEYGAVAIVSGNIDGKTQTATLRVEDAYQFAYGNYAPAYGIALVLAVMAILVLLTMMLVKPREERV
ncbi:MAG TPA: sulfate ABC transporter permease subunit [Gaiellaceae bacterium]